MVLYLINHESRLALSKSKVDMAHSYSFCFLRVLIKVD